DELAMGLRRRARREGPRLARRVQAARHRERHRAHARPQRATHRDVRPQSRRRLERRARQVDPTTRRIDMKATLVLLGLTGSAVANGDTYPAMADVRQYHMSKADEIALAKSAAPPSIADHAEVLVLGDRGYETAVKGTNGFVCFVARSWDVSFASAQFWN